MLDEASAGTVEAMGSETRTQKGKDLLLAAESIAAGRPGQLLRAIYNMCVYNMRVSMRYVDDKRRVLTYLTDSAWKTLISYVDHDGRRSTRPC